MMLIDADKLVKDLINPPVHLSLCGMTIKDVIELVQEQPEVVVRCRDCKWWVLHNNGIQGSGYCKDICASRKADDYCSHGERGGQMTTNQSQHVGMIIPVRCKDCKYASNELYNGMDAWICNRTHWQRSDGQRDADGYCSYGEWRTDETIRE